MDGGTGAVNDRPRFAPAEGASERVSGAGTANHQWPLTSSLELGPLPTAVPCARLHCRNVLAEWQLSELADDAEVIVSELMANALNASQRLPGLNPVALRLNATPSPATTAPSTSSALGHAASCTAPPPPCPPRCWPGWPSATCPRRRHGDLLGRAGDMAARWSPPAPGRCQPDESRKETVLAEGAGRGRRKPRI